MAEIHENVFEIQGKCIHEISYRDNSACVSMGQQPSEGLKPPNIQLQDPSTGKWKISFSCGRHKTAAIATSFIACSGGSDRTLAALTQGSTVPAELNFYFGLNVTIKDKEGLLDEILIYLGQGSNSFNNNWWIGSNQILNVYGKPVLYGKKMWRAKLKISNNGCLIDIL